jgi:type II secretory pathway component PulF
MNKYYVKYTDKSGDLSTVWVNANSEQDAIFRAKHEYWDIDNIIMCYRA